MKHLNRKSHVLNRRGYSFLEAIAVMTIVGIVSAVAFAATSSTYRRTTETKLRSDVATLNRAVQVYIANGGDVSTAEDSQDVLARLKTRLTDQQAAQFVGLTSSMTDFRVTPIYQSPAEAQSDQLRAAWDPSKRRFAIADSGARAIKRFILDDGFAEGVAATESRSDGGFVYALEDEWIWDFEDRPALARTETTTVSIYFEDRDEITIPPSTNPIGDPEPDPEPDPDPDPDPDPNSPILLIPPTFTPGGGNYSFEQFPMAVALQNPNEAGSAVVRYAVNHGSFQTFVGPFTVNEGDTVRAYSATIDPARYLSSMIVNATYQSIPFTFDGSVAGQFRDGNNHAGSMNNAGHGNNLDGADVSNPGQAPIEDESGDFDDEANTAVVSYEESGGDATVHMGRGKGSKASILEFRGTQFSEVEPEEMFRAGTIEYENNMIHAGTEVTSLTLDVTVGLTSSDITETLPVTLGFLNPGNIWNDQPEDEGESGNGNGGNGNENGGNGNGGNGNGGNGGNATGNGGNNPSNGNPWKSAATVYIAYRTIPLTQTINGENYYLVLQLGPSWGNGFSTDGTLTVLSNKTASAPLFGYFTTSPPGGS